MPQITTNQQFDREIEIIIRVTREELARTFGGQNAKIMERIVETIVNDITDALLPQILAKLDSQAIANLAIAESAKLIRTRFIDPVPEPKRP